MSSTNTTTSVNNIKQFLKQAKSFIGYVPFVRDAVAMYYCLIDPQTPVYTKGTIAAALAYFVSPVDAIPDVIAGLGFTDDASVIATVLATVSTSITDEHRQKAEEFFI
ncbi:MAG: YkvA family protein [Cyanophyceae cyanobacterium]